ncbi:hypothetical protein GCM10010393_54430 [Streptomyces gobitricini]|uniref:Uncharacterized protein n=1 Tax=Streptomyces gobitricini TaxID=68211 RepID=A0ABP6AC88_9ACTN
MAPIDAVRAQVRRRGFPPLVLLPIGQPPHHPLPSVSAVEADPRVAVRPVLSGRTTRYGPALVTLTGW